MFCSFFVFAGGVCGADKAIPMKCFVSHCPLSCKCGSVGKGLIHFEVTLRCVQNINLEITEEVEREAFYLFLLFFFFFLELLKKNCVRGDGLTGDRNCSSADIPISSSEKDISSHKTFLKFSRVEKEAGLIQARCGIFQSPKHFSETAICPSY